MLNRNSDIKKILVICPFPQDVAAGQRLKYEQYFDHWEGNGYEVTVSSYIDIPMWKVVYQKGKYFEKILGKISKTNIKRGNPIKKNNI